jgi:polyphosphate kinase 2 (PPK2 family)
LVVRVHPEILDSQRLPKTLVTKHIWQERFEDINCFEQHLTRNGIAVVKFFLHLSRKEQKRRFLERLDNQHKNWKYSSADLKERECWDDYQKAYEEMIQHTATEHAPWYVVPADNKWFTRLVVAEAVVDALEAMDLKYPKVTGDQRTALAAAKVKLENE